MFYKIDFIAASSTPGVVEDETQVYIYIKEMKAGDVLKANRPYIILPNSVGNYEFVSEDVTLYKRTEYPDSRMHLEKSTINYDFYGTYENLQATKENDWLKMASGHISFNSSASAVIGSYRWYIKVTSKILI